MYTQENLSHLSFPFSKYTGFNSITVTKAANGSNLILKALCWDSILMLGLNKLSVGLYSSFIYSLLNALATCSTFAYVLSAAYLSWQGLAGQGQAQEGY